MTAIDPMTGDDDRNDAGQDASVMAFLALYLIVLAFFIVLNAVSKREDQRAKAAIGSVVASFRQSTEVSTGPFDFVGGYGVEADRGDFNEAVRRLFEASMPIARVDPYQPFGRVAVTLPMATLFAPGVATIKPLRRPFLDRFANILRNDSPGQFFEIELLLGTSTDRPGSADRPLAVNRAGALARALRDAGVPAERIVTGIDAGDPAHMQFVINPRRVEVAAPVIGGS